MLAGMDLLHELERIVDVLQHERIEFALDGALLSLLAEAQPAPTG